MIIVNGEEFEIDSGSSVAKLVEERGLDRSRVAVELNGEIVPRVPSMIPCFTMATRSRSFTSWEAANERTC